MNDILLIDKPQDWTSFDVVAKLRGALRSQLPPGHKRAKVGHAGTLDPMATGLLIVLTGNKTKEADSFLKLDKRYDAEITLGSTSNTDDAEGELTPVFAEGDTPPSLEEVHAALEKFTGKLSQVPPQFSAIKVNGKRAYKSARKGEAVELEPRTITVYSIDSVTYEWPHIRCSFSVSSGTYIRSLARDIGQELGIGAYLSSLRRTLIGEYSLANAQTIEAALASLSV